MPDTPLATSRINSLFSQLSPPIENPEFDGVYQDELQTTQYIWKIGSYRCGITVHIIFFFMAPGFVEKAKNVRPQRFGNLIKFANSFDFTDIFIKQVTASGRGKARGIGLQDPNIQRMLKNIQQMHDRHNISHIDMVHFGYRLMQQLESDIGHLTEEQKQLHLQYMSRVYRTMGIPFSADRELLETLCEAIEEKHATFTDVTAEYCQRLLFLGLTVGVPCDKQSLAKSLPQHIRPLFETHYDQLKPGTGWRILGNILNFVLYPRRRYRNPLPEPI